MKIKFETYNKLIHGHFNGLIIEFVKLNTTQRVCFELDSNIYIPIWHSIRFHDMLWDYIVEKYGLRVIIRRSLEDFLERNRK